MPAGVPSIDLNLLPLNVVVVDCWQFVVIIMAYPIKLGAWLDVW